MKKLDRHTNFAIYKDGVDIISKAIGMRWKFRSKRFDLKKFRQAVIESGLTDADIDELISRLLPTPGEK